MSEIAAGTGATGAAGPTRQATEPGTPEPLLSGIGQIAIAVHDIPRSTAFYRDMLGLRFLFDVPDRMAFFDCGGVRLMLSLPEPDFDHPGSVLYFRVADIDAAHQELTRRGVHFVSPPHLVADLGTHELWLAFFRDAERSTHALMQEKPKPTPPR